MTTRDDVLDIIRQFPGLHMREIARRLDVSPPLARYHMKKLEEADLVARVRTGGYVRYFPAEAHEDLAEEEERWVGVLRQPQLLEITVHLLNAEDAHLQHKDLVEATGLSKGTVTHHLNKLIAEGLVEKVSKGPDRGFHLTDPDAVRRMLQAYRPSRDAVDAFADAWEDLFG